MRSLRSTATLAVLFAACPSLPAADQQDPPHVVFLVGEAEYGSRETMPELARELEAELPVRTTVVHSKDGRLPDLAILDEADLIVLYLRFRTATDAQFARLKRWFDEGRPAMALRTTSHAFLDDKGWFPPFFGGHYKAHAPNGEGTLSLVFPAASAHPVLRGVEASLELGHGGTYNAQPLADTAEVLMLGRTGDLPTEPIAWINRYTPESRIFYTSLGSRENFERDAFRKMLANAVLWCLDLEVPRGGALGNDVDRASAERKTVPEPPAFSAPAGATVLFDGKDLSRWRHWDPSIEPRAIGIDGRADSSSGGESYDAARWPIEEGAMVARPGFGDVLTRESFGDYHLHLDFFVPEEPDWVPDGFRGASGVYLGGRYEIQLADSLGREPGEFSSGAIYGYRPPDDNAAAAAGTWQSLDVHYRHLQDRDPVVSAWLNGVQIHDQVELGDETVYGFFEENPGARSLDSGGGLLYARDSDESFEFGTGEFTIAARFRTEDGGTIAAKSPPSGPWAVNAKALFLRDGHLVYDIGWVGELVTEAQFDDGKWHRVLLTHRDGEARLFVDGRLEGDREDFVADDASGHVFKIGTASPDFGGAYRGQISDVQVFENNVTAAKARQWTRGEVVHLGEAALEWVADEEDEPEEVEEPARPSVKGPIRLQADSSPVRFANIWVRPLSAVDHGRHIRDGGAPAVARGKEFYGMLCAQCHVQPKEAFAGGLENGSDPLSLYRTLEDGLATKESMAWIPPGPRYDLIHYVRSELGLPRVSDEYLEALPPGMNEAPGAAALDKEAAEDRVRDWPPYQRMDYGSVLNWTYEVDEDNIAYKAIAVRLDPGVGGLSQGQAFMVYDHDTMRVAAAWSGEGFIDWKGVAFDASHNSHAHLTGDVAIVNPVGPGWADPATGSFDDPRFLGRDDKPYGPLPAAWTRFKGRYQHGDRCVLEYTVGDATVLDAPGFENGLLPVFTRTLEVGGCDRELLMRVAPEATSVALVADDGAPLRIVVREGFHVLQIAPHSEVVRCKVLMTDGDPRLLQVQQATQDQSVEDLRGLLGGGPSRWPEVVTTTAKMGEPDGPYAVDELTLPDEGDNPWHSWMRLGGIDFFADGRRAAVSTWNGDVWIVDGLGEQLGELRWRRIAAGLFQPLGVRVIEGVIYVGCRDQIAVLEDRNGDGETDFYRCFNNDHQVTEHFHEFAMGLQTDEHGNFYYAKSARHALPALVPHHGTLLQVSADGSKTEIVANGFRAANGVCINADGSFYVTDQEGHWTPKNRINRVVRGGFYGNMMGYHEQASKADADMEPPLCWITNAFDRSPAELLRVDSDRWGLPAGSLLQLSYGTGRIFLVLEDQVGGNYQGGMTSLPLEPFPTGIMRGRFHPGEGQLYACGLFGWSGARTRPGGLYRIRYVGGPVPMPTAMRVVPGGLELRFGVGLEREFAEDPDSYGVETWQLRRSGSYGSPHLNERELAITSAALQEDGRTVVLKIPDLQPTMCIQIRCNLDTVEGSVIRPVIHGTIHAIK